jgi:hypothetical protein
MRIKEFNVFRIPLFYGSVICLFGLFLYSKAYAATISPTPVPAFNTCNSSELRIGDYVVYNNMWGKDAVGSLTYSQCYKLNSINPLNATWNWTWPFVVEQVKSYPEIFYGYKPGRNYSTNPSLPIKLADMGSFLSSFDTTTTVSTDSEYDTSFDIFINSQNPPTYLSVTSEVMIWINSQNTASWMPTSHFIRKVTIDGQDYDFYFYTFPYETTTRNFFLFNKVVPISVGSVSIDHFLKYLVNNGYESGANYLSVIEFGNEVVSGTGNTVVRNFSISQTDLPTPTNNPNKSGDANGDKVVNGLDYVVWLNHFGQSISGVVNGDFNSDSKINGLDYVVWLNNFGK